MYKDIIRPIMKDVKSQKPESKSWQQLIKIWLNWSILAGLIMGSWYFHRHFISPQPPIIIQIER